MKKQGIFTGYLFIGIGLFFLLKQVDLPFFTNLDSWPMILIIVGLTFLIYCLKVKEYEHLFTATFLLGLGIHFYGLATYSFWVDHWAVYLLLIGISLFIRFIKTKKGFFQSVMITIIAIIIINAHLIPTSFKWVLSYIHQYWPIAFILVGIYFVKRTK